MTQKIHIFCLEVSRIVYLNILWFIFMLLGGFVFGFFPATIAMFAIYRQRLKGEESLKYTKVFWGYYRKNFITANCAAIVFLVIGLILYFNFNFSRVMEVSGPLIVFEALVNVAILMYIMTLIFFFPVFVHFEVVRAKMFVQPFLMVFFSPLESLGVLLIIFFCGFLYFISPGLTVLFGLSLPASIIMQLMYKRFLRLSKFIDTGSNALDGGKVS